MKATSLISLLVAGLLVVNASAGDETKTGEHKVRCGRNMVAAGCECNQVCHAKEPRICPKRPCPNTFDVCACLPDHCLPNANSDHCIKPDRCP